MSDDKIERTVLHRSCDHRAQDARGAWLRCAGYADYRVMRDGKDDMFLCAVHAPLYTTARVR